MTGSRSNATRPKMRKSDIAYQRLKRAILTLQLAPGTFLVESKLMEEFQVGRTPLREALQRLANEDLIVTVPRRGTFVKPVSTDDVIAVYELRCLLDPFAARLAAERATDEEISRMEALLADVDSEMGQDHVLFDQELHEQIVQATHNPYLEDMLRRLYALSVRLFNMRHLPRESLQEMREELSAVVAAIKARNPPKAAEAALRHVMSRNWFPNRTQFGTSYQTTQDSLPIMLNEREDR